MQQHLKLSLFFFFFFFGEEHDFFIYEIISVHFVLKAGMSLQVPLTCSQVGEENVQVYVKERKETKRSK